VNPAPVDGLYEQALAALGAMGLPAAKPPRASAAVVLWRPAARGCEVYWVRRAETLAFMGGWHAFPGGGLGREDAAVPVGGRARRTASGERSALPTAFWDLQGEPPPDLVPGLEVCALRELYEETGILLALPPVEPQRRAAARRRLLAGEVAFDALRRELGATLDAARLLFAGRWLTPPFAPLRFDNRFFLAEWRPEDGAPEVILGELAEGEWIEPRVALERWRRGAALAAPPILHILEVLAEDGPERGLPRLVAPEEADLGPFRRIEFRPGVLLFPLRTPTLPPASYTNAFLLGHGEALLVDPGSPDTGEIARLLDGLAAARRRLGRRVVEIWLTHEHPDHVGGVEAARRALRVPVRAHPAAAERLRERGLAIDGELHEGEVRRLSGDPEAVVRVLHTPGHARGHLCFFEEVTGSLLAGDMVAGVGTIVVDPPAGDMDDYLASLERLRDLGPRTLFPAHGPASKDGSRRLQEYLDHRLWREELILAAWRSGRREPEAMLATVYDDAPPEARPLAARQIVAHLERLARHGRLPE
jgi:glyoxylase-like metal-dependent hydrolase (beta-lactamase superfamily II)/8-oxo-dGTP pyrophosphatase MutT (NUDIX family)